MQMRLSLLLLLLSTVACLILAARGLSAARPSDSSFSSISLASCSLTFTALDQSPPYSSMGGLEAAVSIVHLCPSNCLNIAFSSSPASSVAVYGSFPYHGNSSICLAAAHAGIVHNAVGGRVFISRFYRSDWSGTATQTVFPYASALGSVSNAVTSGDVPSSWYTEPADEWSWSWTVRGRGDVVSQRRTAPFSPRANHAHAFYVDALDLNNQYWLSQLHPHLIVGGYNGTHYLVSALISRSSRTSALFTSSTASSCPLPAASRSAPHLLLFCSVLSFCLQNDVWLRILPRWSADVGRDVDGVWLYQGLAPFTPRSDMLTRFSVQDDYSPLSWWTIDFIGGQTGHSCGLYEFGLCSPETWQANMTIDPVKREVGLTWQKLAGDMPFRPRCDATLLALYYAGASYAVMAGQLSYNDSTCEAALEYADATLWYRLADGWVAVNESLVPSALTGRRGVQTDSVLMRDSYLKPELAQGRLSGLVGGIRYLSHRVTRHNQSGELQAVLTQAELYADMWSCVGTLSPSGAPYLTRCGIPTDSSLKSWLPSGSVPIPIAAASPIVFPHGNTKLASRVGGISSRQAEREWNATLPPLPYSLAEQAVLDLSQLAVNVTVISAMSFYVDGANIDPTLARFGLPMSYTLQEQELSDPSAPFHAGSDWLQSRSPIYYRLVGRLGQMGTIYLTAHPQAFAIADSPQRATIWLPQAASSHNTSRPRFRFRLRRRDAQAAVWDIAARIEPQEFVSGELVVSGGRSGQLYNNDWLVMHEVRCLPPDDPSFFDALGPVTLLGSDGELADGSVLRGSYTEKDAVLVQCGEGHHWEPPIRRRVVSLICGPNGVWMDMEVSSIRRCSANRLRCPEPWQDFGFAQCDEPTARVDALGPDAGTGAVLEFFAQAQFGQSLEVSGAYFSLPLQVTVGGSLCEQPRLWQRGVSLCLNQTDGSRLCKTFSSRLQCIMPQTRGVRMPVVVLSGEHGTMADYNNSVVPVVSIPSPQILSLFSGQCADRADNLTLSNCSNTRPIQLHIAVNAETVGDLPLAVFLDGDSAPLPCSPLSMTVDRRLGSVNCSISPHLGQGLRLRVLQLRDMLYSEDNTTLSFAQCPAGTHNNLQPINASSSAGAEPVCLPCEKGFSTNASGGASQCQPCLPGFYSPTPGGARCLPCEPGHYQYELAASSCPSCPLNSFQPRPQSTTCGSCSLNSYIVLTHGETEGFACEDCPSGADCLAGNISAVSGAYLLQDTNTGRISSSSCSPSACLSVSACGEQRPEPSGGLVSVTNCCARGRYAAYDASAAALADSGGYNVLCAACLPGYSLANGRCIECSSVQLGALSLVLLLLLAVVYLLHRLPSAFDGSASVFILSNFLQQSALFLSSSATPQLFSLALFNVIGADGERGFDSVGKDNNEAQAGFWAGFCIAPLSAYGRMGMQLLAPAIALTLLAVLGALQLSVRQYLRVFHQRDPDAQDPSLMPAIHGESRSVSLATRMYWLIFVPQSWQRAGPATRQLDLDGDGDDLAAASSVPGGGTSTSSRLQWVTLWLPYQRTAVRLLQLSYNAVALVSLTFFRYVDVGAFGRRVQDYPEVDPASGQYAAWMALMIAVLVLAVLGLPLALLLWLHRARRSGELEAVTRRLPRVLLYQHCPVGAQVSATQPTVLESMRDDLLLQLSGMFRPSCWWMYSFVLLRRLCLITVLVAVRDGTAWVWLSLANSGFMGLHLSLQPFRWPGDNALEAVTLISLIVQTTLLSTYPPPNLNAQMYSALNALVLAPCVTVLAVALRRCWLTRVKPNRSHLRDPLLSVEEQEEVRLNE